MEPADLPAAVTGDPLVLPDEEIMRALAARHELGRGRELVFEPTFLRWDREWSQAQRPARFDGQIAAGDLPRGLIARAQRAGRPQLGLVAAGGRDRRARPGAARLRPGTGITRPSTRPTSTATRGTASAAGCGPT